MLVRWTDTEKLVDKTGKGKHKKRCRRVVVVFFFFPKKICFNRHWHLTASFFVGAWCCQSYCGFRKVLCTAAWATFFYIVTSLLCFTDWFPPIERLLLILMIFTGVIIRRVPTSFTRFIWKQTMFALSAVKSLDLLWQTLAVMSGIEVILNCGWHDKIVWWGVEVILYKYSPGQLHVSQQVRSTKRWLVDK